MESKRLQKKTAMVHCGQLSRYIRRCSTKDLLAVSFLNAFPQMHSDVLQEALAVVFVIPHVRLPIASSAKSNISLPPVSSEERQSQAGSEIPPRL